MNKPFIGSIEKISKGNASPYPDIVILASSILTNRISSAGRKNVISLQCCRFSTDKRDTQESLPSSSSGATKKDQDLDGTKGKGVKKVCMEGLPSLVFSLSSREKTMRTIAIEYSHGSLRWLIIIESIA